MKKKKSYNYYKLDTGFLPNIVKLCYDDKVFQQILKDHDITLKANALETGIGETHSIGNDKDAIIIIVLGQEAINCPLHELADTIAHETSHAIDHLAEYIGEEDGFVGETRAYLTGHLVSQIFKITMFEKEKNARKADRIKAKKESERKRRDGVQVDFKCDRGERPDSISEQPSAPSGT